MSRDDDMAIASDLLARKPGAFDRFVDTYHAKLFRYSYLMCGKREDAEEISQETLLQVFQSLVNCAIRRGRSLGSHLPEDDLLRRELGVVLGAAIGELPETNRSILLLRDVEGLRTEEAAEVLELSRETVRQRLHRARLAVRAKLDDYLRKVGISKDETKIGA